MVSNFPIQAILDRLVESIVEVLPVTAAGVTLISPGRNPHFVAGVQCRGVADGEVADRPRAGSVRDRLHQR